MNKLKKIFLFLLIIGVVVLGIFILRKNPENQLKKIVYPSEYRVMTYNINHGVGTDGMYSLSRIVRVIREQSPHIVCLNDVDYKTDRTYGDEQARKIAAELGMEFTFGRNFEIGGGWNGNAILSKYPFEFVENKSFSSRKGNEPRALLHTIIKIYDKQIHFYGTQLSADSVGSASESKEMLNVILDWGLTQPVIVAGDFNMLSSRKSIREMGYYLFDLGSLMGENLLTFPADDPVSRIDYILINDKIVPKSVYVVNNDNARIASDHLPLIAKFQIK
jgi:endonuclease/exonuclease/phosphatase family metal-dependent hydrolase